MINKAIIIGNLGADPELRYPQSGQQVASFSVATTERWKGQDGQMQEQTERLTFASDGGIITGNKCHQWRSRWKKQGAG